MKPDLEERLVTAYERLADHQPVDHIGYAHPKFQADLLARGYFREFAHPVYQNGKDVPATCLSVELVNKVNGLKAGKYFGGRVTVAHDTRGGIHLSYKNASPDDRMRNQGLFSSFEDLVDKIIAESSAVVPA